jgi:hypothetical protein
MQPLWMFEIHELIYSNHISNNIMTGGFAEKKVNNIIKKYTKYKLIKYY